MNKYRIPHLLLCLTPISAIALALYYLETYNNIVHNECGLLICIYSAIAFVFSMILYLYLASRNQPPKRLWIISTILLIFVFYVGCKIPFCVECDRVTAEELGFLIYWIKPWVPLQ